MAPILEQRNEGEAIEEKSEGSCHSFISCSDSEYEWLESRTPIQQVKIQDQEHIKEVSIEPKVNVHFAHNNILVLNGPERTE